MPEFLIEYLAADRIGTALVVVAIAAVFAGVRHSERLRPARKDSDG